MAHQIHEHDNMISVGQVPWHGLGTTLAEPPESVEKAFELAGLTWTVRKEPMFLQDGRRVSINSFDKNGQEKRIGKYGTIVRDDTNEMLGVVGPGFVPLQNSSLARILEPLVQDGTISVETCGSLFNGRRVWCLGRIKNSDFEVRPGDKVASYLLAAHGHDGTLAMRFGPTLTRVVCQNTLSLAVSDKIRSKLVKCLHTRNLEQNLVTLRDAFVSYVEAFAMTAETFRKLAGRGVSRADLREYARIIVDADKDETDWTGQQRTKIGKIVGAAMEGRGNDGNNWWHAYNGATEYLTWEAGRTRENRLNSLWFGPNAVTGQKALDLAVEMSLAG
jgi:phage/plasmid-like protein (TIGR03299 family)